MEAGHWIAIGIPVATIAGGCAVKIMRLFGRVSRIEETCEARCAHLTKIEKKQDIGLSALRELLVALGRREPGEGINGEDQ